MDSKKSNKIRDIVRLQQILKKWRKTAAGKSTRSSASVPRGYLAVSVGEEERRFVIPMRYLRLPAFEILLREAEEEYGFQQPGVLRLPCEAAVFENVVRFVEGKKRDLVRGDEVLSLCSLGSLHLTPPPPYRTQSPMCR